MYSYLKSGEMFTRPSALVTLAAAVGVDYFCLSLFLLFKKSKGILIFHLTKTNCSYFVIVIIIIIFRFIIVVGFFNVAWEWVFSGVSYRKKCMSIVTPHVDTPLCVIAMGMNFSLLLSIHHPPSLPFPFLASLQHNYFIYVDLLCQGNSWRA